jgi:hypothetical protein
MKPPLRIGIFFLAIAVSLFLAAFQRAYSPVTFGGGTGNLQPNQWRNMSSRLLGPQSLRITFSTVNGTPINLYLLNSQELQEWKETGTINAIIRIENLPSTINTYDIASRDVYTLLVYNPNNTTEGIHIDLTLYGFEKDLILTIAIITIIGIALPTIYFISEKVTVPSHKKEA